MAHRSLNCSSCFGYRNVHPFSAGMQDFMLRRNSHIHPRVDSIAATAYNVALCKRRVN